MGIPLDEVTSALDADATATVENVILELNREGITILWVTHSDTQSRKYANKQLTIGTVSSNHRRLLMPF